MPATGLNISARVEIVKVMLLLDTIGMLSFCHV
jgi:hypothetical protein